MKNIFSNSNESNKSNNKSREKTLLVTVRVWYPHNNSYLKSLSEGEVIGHISLQIGKHYISFWPLEGSATESVAGVFMTLKDDIKNEGNKNPDDEVTLETLNTTEMLNKYTEISNLVDKGEYLWTLSGSNLTNGYNKNCNSCSGLVYDLLRVGGIEELVSIIDNQIKFLRSPSTLFSNKSIFRDVLCTTPKSVFDLAKEASDVEKNMNNEEEYFFKKN